MSSNKIKVVGYSQKLIFENGIEYRPFSPDLVGLQLASDGGTPLFTMGNFSITTNMDPKSDKTFITNKFSKFITLSDLNLSLEQTQELLTNNSGVILNLDKTNLNNYALFGSLVEFVRVSLEDIIIKWPASLFLSPNSQTSDGTPITGYTFENYSYNALTNTAKFDVNTNFIINKFGINYLENGTIVNTFNETNNLRNLTVNYDSYSVLYGNNEFDILNFTASTQLTNDYIHIEVEGNPFSGLSTNSNVTYHIKPNKISEESFFNGLSDFEAYLLNRQITPVYSSVFKYPIKSDDGVILYITDKITWPVSDGYNIDFDTTAYADYVNKLLEISSDNDLISSDLMNRFLVTESISDFDTTPVHLSDLDQDTSGQKMNKTLRIYGAEYDKINNFISGIAFANVVTYDKQDNTPDIYLKNLAKVLGWDLISSVIENDLLSNYLKTAPSTYSGLTVGLTPVEADVELWRRLILNTPWLWKSKGARKSVEFLLRFIGAPQGLIKFNEYIYKADGPIDINLFTQILQLNGLNTDLSQYPIDSDGYPNPLPNTPDMYFQSKGLWYRETGGSGSTIDILTGNNPHLGPYDGGFSYINQFRSLIPNFSAVTLSSETTTTGTTNLFVNYNSGEINKYSGSTYVDVVDDNNSSLIGCYVVTSDIIKDPMPKDLVTNCNTVLAADDNSLSICLEKNTKNSGPCGSDMASQPIDDTYNGFYYFEYLQYNQDGSVFVDNNTNPVVNESPYVTQDCCRTLVNGTPWLYDDIENGIVVNSGYICCDATQKCGCYVACNWDVVPTPIYLPQTGSTQLPYLKFVKPDGTFSVTTPDGCNCVTTINTTGGNYVATIDSSWFLINRDKSYEVYTYNGDRFGFTTLQSDLPTTMMSLVDSINNKVPNGSPVPSFTFNTNLDYTATFDSVNNLIHVYKTTIPNPNYLYFFMMARIPNTASVGNYKFTLSPNTTTNVTKTYTTPIPNITDPYTGQVGYGCQLTTDGLNDLQQPSSQSILKTTYANRKSGNINCDAVS